MENPFEKLFEEGDTINYLGRDFVILYFKYDYYDGEHFMVTEYMDAAGHLRRQTFTLPQLPALRKQNTQ